MPENNKGDKFILQTNFYNGWNYSGGEGNDEYYVGDGDIIDDYDAAASTQNQGSIVFNGLSISGLTFTEVAKDENDKGIAYENEAENVFLTIVGNDAVILQLDEVTKEATSFRINHFKQEGQDFNNGDFGIINRISINNTVFQQAAWFTQMIVREKLHAESEKHTDVLS